MTNLVKKTGGALALPAATLPDGFEDLSISRDLLASRWNLMQPTSRKSPSGKSAIPGKFRCNSTDEIVDTVRMVILRVSPSRSMFSKPPDMKLVCKSFDAVSGGYGQCNGCDFTVWPPLDENGHQDPPPCGFGYTYYGVNPDEPFPIFTITASGTSVKIGRDFQTRLLMRGKMRKPIYSWLVEWGATEVEDSRGHFWMLSPQVVEGVEYEGEKLAEFQLLYRLLKSSNVVENEADFEPVGQEPYIYDAAPQEQEEVPF